MCGIFSAVLNPTLRHSQSNIPVAVAKYIFDSRFIFAIWARHILHEILGRQAGCKEQLVDVEKIYATDAAFAALKRDGSVVVWGHPEHGGDCQKVQDRIRNTFLLS